MPIGEDPIAGYTFNVEIDGLNMAQFKEVSGVSSEVTVIEHRENKIGGIPVMKKLPGATKFGDIQLKRGKINDPGFWKWIKQVQDGDIDGARRNGSVTLFDYARGEQFRINFQAGWPSKVSIGSLQAGSSDVLIEDMTIVVERMEVA
jgi:phage tail-like protein